MAAPTKKVKKKNIKLVTGVLHVTTTSNNTHVVLTDMTGNKISGGATGLKGFKGAKESTPYAAEVLARDVLKEAKDSFGLKEIAIIMKGV
jgi:small subunit ribosomal protein S11